MPTSHVIDKAGRRVLSRAWGVLTGEELLAAPRALRAEAAFEPSLDQLCDFGEVTSLLASTEQIRQAAEASPFCAGARRAFFAPSNLIYGMCRMYIAYAQSDGVEAQVFRELESARVWLGLQEPAHDHARPGARSSPRPHGRP
jgi:hypothetical protein